MVRPFIVASTGPTVSAIHCRVWASVFASTYTFEAARAHPRLETQRRWSDRAMARTTPVLVALFSILTVMALRLSHAGQIRVPMTAWSHEAEPTLADCVALVRQPLWRARFFVNSAAEPEFVRDPPYAPCESSDPVP